MKRISLAAAVAASLILSPEAKATKVIQGISVANHAAKALQRVLNSTAVASATMGASGASLPCEAVICLSPYVGNGTDGGPGCVLSKQTYFNIRVYDPWSGFDAPLTAAVRKIFLGTCPNPEVAGFAALESAALGQLFAAP